MYHSHPVLDSALEYARKGWHVLPLIPKGKIPASKHGLKDASTTPNQLLAWFENHPDLNLGIRTGKCSNLVVLDIDKKSGGIGSWEALVDALKIDVKTYTIQTQGGGYHLYFTAPKDVVLRNRTNIRPGLDLRAEDGYVVAPPSVGYEPYTTDPISEIPQQLLEVLLEKIVNTANPVVNSNGSVIEGGRNHYLTQVAGKLQRSNLLTLGALQDINVRDCNPPLHVWEVETIFNSVSRYAPKESATSSHTNLLQPGPRDATGATAELEPLTVSAGQYTESMLLGLADKERVRGQTTGIEGLDKLLGGGFREKELGFLSATAKTGKSSLLIQLIYNLIDAGIPVGFASAEMEAASEILPSLLSIEFQENAWLEELTDKRAAKYSEALAKWPLHFLGNYGTTPIERFEAWVRDCKTKGVKYFFADHLHFLCENSEEFKLVAEYARRLKKLTITEEISLLLVVQPSQIADGQQLDMHKLRGGSSLSQVMNYLLVMERYRDPNNNFKPVPNVVCLKLDAARSKLARPGRIYLGYNPDTTAISEVEPEPDKGPTMETEDV